MDKEEKMPTGSGLNMLAGIWLIVAPFILSYNNIVATWNDIILGILIGGAALIGYLWAAPRWLNWLNAIFGLWLIISPFFLGLSQTTTAAGVNDIILGVVVVLLAVWSLFSTPTLGTTRPSRV